MLGYKVLYANTTKLFAKLKMSKADGSYIKEIARIEKQDLLILDDFGIQPFDNQSRSSLMEIIEDRHGKRSTIITSQLPVLQWHEIIGENTIADYPNFFIMQSIFLKDSINQSFICIKSSLC